MKNKKFIASLFCIVASLFLGYLSTLLLGEQPFSSFVNNVFLNSNSESTVLIEIIPDKNKTLNDFYVKKNGVYKKFASYSKFFSVSKNEFSNSNVFSGYTLSKSSKEITIEGIRDVYYVNDYDHDFNNFDDLSALVTTTYVEDYCIQHSLPLPSERQDYVSIAKDISIKFGNHILSVSAIYPINEGWANSSNQFFYNFNEKLIFIKDSLFESELTINDIKFYLTLKNEKRIINDVLSYIGDFSSTFCFKTIDSKGFINQFNGNDIVSFQQNRISFKKSFPVIFNGILCAVLSFVFFFLQIFFSKTAKSDNKKSILIKNVVAFIFLLTLFFVTNVFLPHCMVGAYLVKTMTPTTFIAFLAFILIILFQIVIQLKLCSFRQNIIKQANCSSTKIEDFDSGSVSFSTSNSDNNSKSIAIFSNSIYGKGADSARINELIKVLSFAGFKVFLFCYSTSLSFGDTLFSAKDNCVFYSLGNVIKRKYALIHMSKNKRREIMFELKKHNITNALIYSVNHISLIKNLRKGGIKLFFDVVEIRHLFCTSLKSYLLFNRKLFWINHLAINKDTTVICISKYIKNFFDKRRIASYYFPNCVLEEAKIKKLFPDNKTHFIYSGRPGHKKDEFREMISAFAMLDDAFKNRVVLHICGVDIEYLIYEYNISLNDLMTILPFTIFEGVVSRNDSIALMSRCNYSIVLRNYDYLTNKAGFSTKLAESISLCTPLIFNESEFMDENIINENNSIKSRSYKSSDVKSAIEKAILLDENEYREKINFLIKTKTNYLTVNSYLDLFLSLFK